MGDTLRIALAQINPLVGDVAGNARRVIDTARRAGDELQAELVVYPELTLTGYPPEDLLHHVGLRTEVERELASLCDGLTGIAALVGLPEWSDDGLHNAAVLIADGAVRAIYRKCLLPNYAVFDEKRYFTAVDEPVVIEVGGVRVGITICEDGWYPGPTAASVAAGAEVVVNLSASPFEVGRQGYRARRVFGPRAVENGVPVICVNLVGGQDELVFDGGSLAIAADGSVAVSAPVFEEALVPVDLERGPDGRIDARIGDRVPDIGVEESMWRAIALGTRDYADKNGFTDVVLGLSGGIDSALCATVAADALGPERVHTVMMPSEHTATISVEDAADLAAALGTDHRTIPIASSYEALTTALARSFHGRADDITEQNLQARIRGTLLMALSNKFGWLVLLTGNKSEFGVGYSTLYGDMAGGFAPLKDVTKTMVYRLAGWRNAPDPVIPRRIIERPPTAELAPGQTDQDHLPPYAELDAILVDHVEKGATVAELVAAGHEPGFVRRVVDMIKASEYKRRQAAPGVRVTGKAFGRDRRYPITSGYRGDR